MLKEFSKMLSIIYFKLSAWFVILELQQANENKIQELTRHRLKTHKA